MPDVERKPCQKERKERVGKTSERKLLRKELQTQGGVHRKDPGDWNKEKSKGGTKKENREQGTNS